ncbi:MAG: AAA family ATPase, partial [Ramlibacter sp.]|nr:AAA family ATPase [Ramlibacter sp.]
MRATAMTQTTTSSTPQHTLVAALARALGAQLIETHISWVLLTADHAYKLKKPVRLPFLDYGTLQARRHFCEEEVRLNRRLAPSIYLGVTRITGTPAAPGLDGPGPVLEYAVRMRRFPPGALFGERLAAGTLTGADVDHLAALLADFHGDAARIEPGAGLAGADSRRAAARAALEGAGSAARPQERARLQAWLDTQATALAPLWAARLAGGHVRECHGDLHLDNVVGLDGRVAAFDCIEFAPALRWIDVLDDIAFTVMDFGARGRRDFAFRLLNAWLDRTGEHDGVPALRFAIVYRALVRAQVARLRGAGHEGAARRYLECALSWTAPAPAQLFITHGLPGSGKTFQSQRLLEREGAIRLRSDVERKRLFGLGMLEDSGARGLDLYNEAATARTYDRLFAAASLALAAGHPVVLDAAFLRRDERSRARALAHELGVPFFILDCAAPLPVLRERLLARQGDASEADVAVLEKLREAAQPLEPDELALVRKSGE